MIMYEMDKTEAVQMLEDGMDIIVKVGGDEFTIGDMHNYIGAPESETGYISEYLGNVYYSDAERIIKETVKGMADGDEKLISEATFYLD